MDARKARTDFRVRVLWSICLLVLSAGPAAALEMTSASYTSRGGNPNGGGSTDLTSTAPLSAFFSELAGSLGQREAVGLSGSPSNLTTSRPGFWAIVQGELPFLDADSDGIQSFLDDDDDNDGLTDDVETRTGIFVSSFDTGTDPNNQDSDGDGVLDGPEVLAGTDPNVFDLPEVPALSTFGRAIAVAWIAVTAARRLRWRNSRQPPSKSM
jgi:hypothetical protein